MVNWNLLKVVKVYSLFFFFRMLVNIIFVVCFVVYGVVGKLFSKGNVNNLELVKFY